LLVFFRGLALALALLLATGPLRANPALLVDMRTREILFAEEAGRPWYPASLTKMTTALVAFRAIEGGRVSLDTPVILSARAVSAPGGKSGLPAGNAVTMQDALNLLIVKSANDIAIAIAETVSGSVEPFVGEMNALAQELGMSATNYVNPHGLFSPAQVTSARDLAILALTIRRHYPQYAEIFATSVVELGDRKLESQNSLLTEFSGTNGMKTGYLCAAGLNVVASVERDDQQLLAVVLGSASARERAQMAAKLVLDYLGGRLPPTGVSLSDLANDAGAVPKNMRPFICGPQTKSYAAERAEAFPYGLDGQPSFLSGGIPARTYRARNLGRIRMIDLPRPRPVPGLQILQTPRTGGVDLPEQIVPENLYQGIITREIIANSHGGVVPFPKDRPHS
jgi:D-alanyl-D-alanine carboxypeptidase